MDQSRRTALHLFGGALVTAGLVKVRGAHAQVADETKTEPLTLVRRGIDRELDVINIDLLEEDAKAVYSEAVYAFVTRGSGREWTLHENQRAWGDYVFTPHRMSGVANIDTSITLLGEKLAHPLMITPFGSHALHHPAGEVATAQGAERSDTLLCVSSASTRSLEEIATASQGPKWFQIYLNVDEGLSRAQLQRARAAGYKAIIITVDAIGQGSSDEYVRLGRARPWLPYGNSPNGNANAFKTDLSWRDVDLVRQITGLPVVVKGVTRPEDARAAITAGASAIQVSNHGGRALDGTPASISVLPSIAEAVRGEIPIIFDSGVRRGTDAVKALALGAQAVAVGRPVMFGLAVGGPGGVDGVMKYFRRELLDTMLHCGVSKVSELNGTHVRAA